MIRRIVRSRWLVTLTATITAVTLFVVQDQSPCNKALAADGFLPSDYCYVSTLTATLSAGGTLTNKAVRVPFNGAGLVSSGQLDNEGWDLHPTTAAFANETDVMAGNLSSATGAWWFHVPSITSPGSATINLYFGASDVSRDQGMLFTGSDSTSTAHVAGFNISDNLTLNTRLEILDTTVAGQNSTIASHWSASQGYRLLFISSGGLKVRAQIDGHAGCDVGPLTTSDDNINLQVNMTFTNPNVTVQVVNDAGTVLYTNTCNTGLASISSVSTPFVMGTTLSQTILRDVRLLSGSAPAVHYGFNPKAMSETSAVNPTYTGTILDESGNGLAATYTLTRDMSSWTTSVGAVQLVSSANAPAIPSTDVDVVGNNQFGLSFSITPTPQTNDTFYTLISPTVVAFSGGVTLGWVLTFIAFALGAAVIAYAAFRYMPFAIFAAGIPLVYGTVRGFLPAWALFVWAMFTIGAWLAFKFGDRSGAA